MKRQRECRQCGTCCRKGGPALRREDLRLVQEGIIAHSQLITIRQGELGYNPATDRLEPVPVELLKIRGQGQNWTCLFFAEATSTCSIHAHRPATCMLLECWQPEALLASIYQDTLQRCDLINPNDPILAHLTRHEEQCPGRQWTTLLEQYSHSGENAILARLTGLARKDLALRREIGAARAMSVELEFFLLGRPFITQMGGSGLVCVEEGGTIHLRKQQKESPA